MRLTYEKFQLLPMDYVFGLNRDDLCARKYVNNEWGICKEVVTPRKVPGDIYSGFKRPKVTFYRGANGPLYKTARELYEGEFLTPWYEGVAPHHPGWYETDRGMLHWTPFGWLRNEDDVITVLPPKQWRGTKDIPTNPASTESNA